MERLAGDRVHAPDGRGPDPQPLGARPDGWTHLKSRVVPGAVQLVEDVFALTRAPAHREHADVAADLAQRLERLGAELELFGPFVVLKEVQWLADRGWTVAEALPDLEGLKKPIVARLELRRVSDGRETESARKVLFVRSPAPRLFDKRQL